MTRGCPNVARVYDYFLGGRDNYAVDRAQAQTVIKTAPDVPLLARLNRYFLARVVYHLAAEAKIDQFLDIGSGLPTQDNVHQVAQRADPGARVVYADHDPLVVVHAQALLADTPTTHVISADLRDPRALLHQAGAHLDFCRPVAILLFAILHFFPDGGEHDPYRIVATLRDALAPGSYLAISHAEPTPAMLDAAQHYTAADMAFRDHAQVRRFFEGTTLVEPGVVRLHQWRPAAFDAAFPYQGPPGGLGGVARKP